MKKDKANLQDCLYSCEEPSNEERKLTSSPRNLSRRHFLAEGAAALLGAGLWLKGKFYWRNNLIKVQTSKRPEALPGPWPGRVLEINSPAAFSQGEINRQVVAEMLERGLRQFTGKASLAEAWSHFVKPEDIIGIKLNCLGGPLCSSSKEVVEEIIRGLKLAGVKEDNIIVWDRRQYHMTNCGYKVNRSGAGVKYYGPEIKRVSQEDMNGYDAETYIESDIVGRSWPNPLRKTSKRSYFARIMSRQITKLINLPVLKDHGTAGVTLCLKNLGFGLVNNTSRFHPAPYYCAPIMSAVGSHPIVRSKTVLHILDALNGVWDKGPNARPGYVWQYKSLLIGTDPVAIDRIGYNIIEAKRGKEGAPSIGNRALHIGKCGEAGLGNSRLFEIQHQKITI